jgi:DNA-binding FadR family transcriptional regulator
VRLASVNDHKKVSDAILAGDPATAQTAMRELIEEALDLIRRGEGIDAKGKRVTLGAARSSRR